jgi:hypothetical protein
MSKIKEANDHEVAMAQSSLQTIIDAAKSLQTKIGNMEIDLPGWIQDHITNSENYINQANKGFHKLQEGLEPEEIILDPNAGNPHVLNYGLWTTQKMGNAETPSPVSTVVDPNFDRDPLAYQAAKQGMSREEWIAHYGSDANMDGSLGQ